ncbi:dynamin family protein [Desulfatitalea alkaliphila]|uniref:Dynamin family protein n=1 Tax=Desulfatitalea alkaliphila TaxID=2929485 RepID=A0AA41UIK0_9BACT|nr:dynamin family protein [Desulfatitalea alkaliphila]MCJ8499632.1 dynamin family protein [Desulfatitalea alkaliphila]
MTLDTRTGAAMQTLREQLPALLTALGAADSDDLRTWTHALDVKLLPKLHPDFPMVVAVCGGGSGGKSTLFNSLVGEAVSPMGGRAGLNRRVLAALHPRHLQQAGLLDYLAQAFGGPLQPLTDAQQLTTPGDPFYHCHPGAPQEVVLLDTPDIDTGARGAYHNREQARQSLESADAFIYIFTNATYNNRDNTDFIAQLLTQLGTRPCYLVYRVYPAFTADEVRAHAATVAANLYGPDHKRHVLGVLRADEDNRVAAGEQPVTLRTLAGEPADLAADLATLDTGALRRRLMGDMLADAVAQARRMVEQARRSRADLGDYIGALESAQQKAVQQALSHFPTDQVLRRFADIWQAGDPAHIKWMRRTGRVVEWPYKMVASAVSRLRPAQEVSTDGTGKVAAASLPDQLRLDLIQAATGLHRALVADHITTPTATVAAHPTVRPAREGLRRKAWQEILTRIQDQRETILSWSEPLEKDLADLADALRARMGLMDQVRQTFAAMLNVIPATAAVTYILHTADPAGAVGIKVKLTGLLGLNDLVALIAIPATAGMKSADQRQLEQLLAPVAQTWLAHKLNTVAELFETQITGEVLTAAREATVAADHGLQAVAGALAALKEV